MKTVFNLFVLICLSLGLQAQSQLVDMGELKLQFAEIAGIEVSAIKSAEILSFGDQHYAKFRYTKDNNPVTTAQELRIGGPGASFIGEVSITCTGVGCAECDIEGLPDPRRVYCKCVRPTTENGYCNMTKSIKLGG